MIQICSRCLMPSSRPRIVFTDGVCNACLYHESQKEIDWDARAKEFSALVGGIDRSGPYDCIVPFSGGKDSASIAWKLKFEHGLNPLLACYGQLLWTDVGRYNFDRCVASGLDAIYWRVNQAVSRKLARRFMIERGHPKQHYDAAVNSVPLITAVNFGIPLVFYAEHGESEYGGLVLDEESRRSRNLTEVLENQIGDDPRNWATGGLSERDLAPYIYPDTKEIERVGVKAYYYSYFFPWNIYENAKLARDKMGFGRAQNPKSVCEFCGKTFIPTKQDERIRYCSRHCGVKDMGRRGRARRSGKPYVSPFPPLDLPNWWGKSDGSFEGWDSIDDKIDDTDFWLMGKKFGFARATRMASRLIQGGHMTRDQGIELVRRYDHEFPQTYLADVLEYLSMTKQEFLDVAEKHRQPEIWKQESGKWQLRFPPK